MGGSRREKSQKSAAGGEGWGSWAELGEVGEGQLGRGLVGDRSRDGVAAIDWPVQHLAE